MASPSQFGRQRPNSRGQCGIASALQGQLQSGADLADRLAVPQYVDPAELVEGRVRDLRNGTEFDQTNEQVQTCVTAAVGDCTFDI